MIPCSADSLPCVLLVDDDPAVTDALRRALFAKPFRVVTANSGEEALRRCRQGDIDAVVADEQMPGMAGSELLARVRVEAPGAARLILTGHASIDAVIRAINEGGVTRYLRKPCPPPVLAREIEFALTERDSDQEHSGISADSATFDEALGTVGMVYQPIVSRAARRAVATEALLRPRHPAFAHVGALLSEAARMRRDADVDFAVHAAVGRDFDDIPDDLLVCVNVHPVTLLHPRLLSGLAPLLPSLDRVVFEITERAALTEGVALQETLAALRRRGARFAVDDIGSGYSGLTSIAQLRPEFVKLDMSLVRGIDRAPTQMALADALVGLCRRLGIHLVAEGVETTEEHDTLADLGVDLLQGYLFARPGAPAQAITW